MVWEIAEFAVLVGHEEAFEEAYREARPFLVGSPGCLGATMTRGIESPSRFVLVVEWERLEDHTVGFRESEAFTQWRARIAPHFDGPPSVAHASVVADSR